MTKKYSLGIDLGTSNSCLSLCGIEGEVPRTLDITQVLGAGLLGEKATLPSSMYIPGEAEFGPDSLKLPWSDTASDFVIGAFARERGAMVPDRLVTSAKSWLCNPHIDRHAPILPWKSEIETGKVSPFEASKRYLEHMRQAFEYRMAMDGQPAAIADCQITLTVPASFDEVARTLTHDAAFAAGLGNVTLLEEPQAAFYAWIAQAGSGSGQQWTEQVAAGDLILVCDVGGGTADFSLIAVAEAQAGLSKNLELHRIAVGEHILLGGDNMDLALAYALQAQLEEEGNEIDNWQFLSLVQNARSGKERLLSDDSLQEFPIVVPSRGSSLFAQTVATTLHRSTAVSMILDGYFPLTEVGDLPERRKSVGLQEYGLDYATEPALSRHLARFLQRALENVRSDPALSALIANGTALHSAAILRPTAVLFNGGVFQSDMLRERVLALLQTWVGSDHTVKQLESAGLDIAVSRGAAYYGAVQLSGLGIKIRAGTSRSYYLGLESPMPAVPGFTPPVKGICIVPQGVEEGTELELPGKEFGLVTGEPVEFRFFSSEVRAGDRVGNIVPNALKTLDELSSLTITLPSVEDDTAQQVVPVTLSPSVTEVGTLELWLKHTQSEQKWKLEFNLRAKDS